ncbi:MAG: hypothetical protein EB131_06785, partial [Betaproteobacteria bacterium]|nr:hypothetical protein [Betaproteobacteria bacterium]
MRSALRSCPSAPNISTAGGPNRPKLANNWRSASPAAVTSARNTRQVDSSEATVASAKVSRSSSRQVVHQSARGQPVLLDFTADWCTTCRELER